MTVRLHIERLVVEGLAMTAHEATLIQSALEAELGALLGSGAEMRWAGTAVPSLPSMRFVSASELGADELGRQAAAALYGGLKP
ncbi:MAG TPA: hypothetical protein VEW71_09985 [Allosphingosinicella sp.]|nr:hypothetical protein [Allosphingosinicella sp.]